jgi:phytoene/squalene synthetase
VSDIQKDLALQSNFLQEHLNRVSRSFAYGIERLDLGLRVPVGLAYLLCRLLDTVEDSIWPEFQSHSEAFKKFDSFMMAMPNSEEVLQWVNKMPVGLPEGELLLLRDSEHVFRLFHALPHAQKEVIRRGVLSMSAGMKYFMGRKAQFGELRLESLQQVERYCFFVAGLVGEILSGLVAEFAKLSISVGATASASNSSVGELPLVDGCRFGLFLQKVNILKDQFDDEREGRWLVPSREGVSLSLREDARGSLRYLQSIPISLRSYRLFCAWALYLGLASLPGIRKRKRSGPTFKIPRSEALLIGMKVERLIDDAAAMNGFFEQLFEAAFAFDSQSNQESGFMSSADSMGAGADRALEYYKILTPESQSQSEDERDQRECGHLLSLYDGGMPPQDLLGLFQGAWLAAK